jgi:hypothetical protein
VDTLPVLPPTAAAAAPTGWLEDRCPALPDALLLALRVALDGRAPALPGAAAGAEGALGLLLGRSRCFSAAGLLLATVARPSLVGRVLAPRPPAAVPAAALWLGAALCPGADARRPSLGVPPLKAAAPAAAVVLRCTRWVVLAAPDPAAAALVVRCFVVLVVPSTCLLLLPAPAAVAPAPLLTSPICCDASSANCMSALVAALLRVRRAPVPVKRAVAVGLVQEDSA